MSRPSGDEGSALPSKVSLYPTRQVPRTARWDHLTHRSPLVGGRGGEAGQAQGGPARGTPGLQPALRQGGSLLGSEFLGVPILVVSTTRIQIPRLQNAKTRKRAECDNKGRGENLVHSLISSLHHTTTP
ncbi:uncharacterized protein VTP21DRAFT_2185 [Calcarisporiella thermophila]|uniref:uncharacterized protein n=1 Tax=Calcarisporiella thermophila TaxID=911321 RepID=UPI0037447DD3